MRLYGGFKSFGVATTLAGIELTHGSQEAFSFGRGPISEFRIAKSALGTSTRVVLRRGEIFNVPIWA